MNITNAKYVFIYNRQKFFFNWSHILKIKKNILLQRKNTTQANFKI